MDTQMAREFFYAVSYSTMMNLHLKVLYGENDHHKLEAMFKRLPRRWTRDAQRCADRRRFVHQGDAVREMLGGGNDGRL